MICVLVPDDKFTVKHIRNASCQDANTLCGFMVFGIKEIESNPDCPECLGIVKYCKKLQI